jgi:sugar phosphate isomerase/epimerase
MFSSDDLTLCAGTMMNASFEDHLRAAAAGGFRRISLYPTEYDAARESGLSDADMKRRLDDHGLLVADLDPLLNWIPETSLARGASAEGSDMFGATEADFYRLAEVFGARSINAALFIGERLAPEVIAEAFAALCDRAAGHGLLVHLEYLPWTQIPNLKSALHIVELANRPNGGLMIDTWHHFRSSGSAADFVGVPGERILAVQLNDAPTRPDGNHIIDETLHHRRLPGDGDIELVEVVHALHATGCQAPIGVEVFSDALAQLTPDEIGRRCGDSTRGVLAKAGI